MQPQHFSHLVSLMATLQRDEDMLDVWNTYSQQEGYRWERNTPTHTQIERDIHLWCHDSLLRVSIITLYGILWVCWQICVYRELVMDAVKACESGPCVKVMSSLATENHHSLPRSALHSWLTSLHFHTHVHPQAVSYIMVCSHFFLHYSIVLPYCSVMTDDELGGYLNLSASICILVFWCRLQTN